jgi:hypothetical protein
LLSFDAFEHHCWVVTNAETIHVGILRIEDILNYSRVFTFDDSAIAADSTTNASSLLMAVDIVVGTSVIGGKFPGTEVKLLAIFRVRKISV